MNITLAIPNYNGSENIQRIIPRVLQEEFDEIYVIDDLSTDDSLKILEKFGDKIKVIEGKSNVGAGSNRNRIIEYVKEGVIMFLDVDMELHTENIRSLIDQTFKNEKIGLAGGLILNKSGKPMEWNFGPEMHPINFPKSEALHKLAEKYAGNEAFLADIYKLALPYSPSWSLFNTNAASQNVDWVAEGIFCVRASLFSELKGYDPRMRFHETQDLGRRIREKGFSVRFEPTIVARHLEIDVRGTARDKEYRDAQLYFYQKFWGMSEELFIKLYES